MRIQRMKMPKPGYTTIVVKESDRRMLEEIAETQGYRSINQLLEAWIGVYPTSIIGEIKHPKNRPEISPFPRRKFKSFGGVARI